jgi:hypothetical protein
MCSLPTGNRFQKGSANPALTLVPFTSPDYSTTALMVAPFPTTET